MNNSICVTTACLLLGATAPLAARTVQGDRYLAEGRACAARKQWDAALASYRLALSQDPAEMIYQMATEKAVFQAAGAHVALGRQARAQGLAAEAVAEFERASALAPGLAVASQELAATREMMRRNDRLTPLERVKQEQEEERDRILPVPDLQAGTNGAITLTMVNQSPKVLFETVGKYAGMNVLFDPEYQPGKNFSLTLDGVTPTQALDHLALLSKSFWKALSQNTVFVTNDNPNKRRDYEAQVTRVFYLSNVNTPQEMQEIINTVRSMADLQRVMPYSTQYAIIARGEADKITLAAALIADLDKPRSEVVVDILVLEASQVFSRKITAALASTGLSLPINFSPRASVQTPTTTSTATTSTTTTSTTSTTASTIPLSSLGHLASADFSVSLPGALLQAVMSDAGTHVLQAPQLRAVDSIKATLKIGDRQPTATGSYSSGAGTATVSALVNTQFTYIDVGVNVDITPRVHDNGDVSMHVELEISSVNGHVTLGGIDEPIIGQRKVVHDIRMRAGEVSLLAGLVSQQDTKSTTGIPGLSGIPILRRLFTGESLDRNRSELMIAIIPHVVRGPVVTPANLRGIDTGTAGTVKLNLAPKTPER
jgi:general secretion pathway protein D